MNNFTLKIVAFLMLTIFGLQVQAQRFPSDIAQRQGTYKIKLQNEELYLTLNTTTDELTYEAILPNDDEKQVFSITEHPRGAYYVITSSVAGKGVVEAFETAAVTSKLGCKGNSVSTVDSPTPVQQDQWDPTRGSGTEIFLRNDDTGTGWAGAALRRIANVVTPAAGVSIELNGSSTLQFDFIKLSSLSTEAFEVSSVIMSNPVKDNVSITGLTAEINQIHVYSLLGAKVLSQEVNNAASLQMNVSGLSKGMYIVDFVGENGNFTKKLIKE